MQMKITTQQVEALLKARGLPTSQRKAEKRRIFQSIHTMYNLPKTQKIVLFIENPGNPLYAVIRDKRTKLPLDDGKPSPVAAAPVEAVKAKAAPKAKPVVKAPAKATKVAAKVAKAPAKATKVAAKPAKAAPKPAVKAKAPAAKKVAAKAPTKPSKAPAKQAVKPAVKKVAAKPAKKVAAKKVAKK